jgi:hypothetical protein
MIAQLRCLTDPGGMAPRSTRTGTKRRVSGSVHYSVEQTLIN